VNRLLILGWHNVQPTPAFPGPADGAAALHRQLRWLRRVARVVPLREALDRLEAGAGLGGRAVAITFDDGYRDNLDLAVPVLADLGLPATFFLVPAFLGGSVQPWWEQLAAAFASARAVSVAFDGRTWPLTDFEARRRAERDLAAVLKRLDASTREQRVRGLIEQLDLPGGAPRTPAMLDWDDATDLVRLGFDVGSHSLRHVILSREAPAVQRADLEGARRALSEGLGVNADLVAYPNGGADDYDEGSIAAARAAGHRGALTTRPGWNRRSTPRFELRRAVIAPTDGLAGLARSTRWSISSDPR